MKHSTFRKSSLISSVALLLVAIVALSGATFAWFTANNTASATGISMKSTSASGLLISETGDDGTWGSSVTYANGVVNEVDTNRKDTLAPASSAFAGEGDPAFFSATAETLTNYAKTGEFSALATLAGYVNKYELHAMPANAAESGTLSVALSSVEDTGSYGRLAITNAAGDLLFYYTKTVDAKDGDPATGATTTASGFYTTNEDVIVNGANSSKSLGTITGDTTFYIYVWNEGQDSDCISTNSGKALTGALSFEFTAAAAQG